MRFETLEKFALALTAVFSILLSGAAVVSIVVLAGLLSQFAAVPLHAQTRPAVELEAAMTKEQVDGDLKTAIAAYQKIAADKAAPRDVRAKALLHLAGCYEKLGQQAQSVYQQIVRDFGDQPAATQARARLAALKEDDRPVTPATMTQRKIESSGRHFGEGDTDGHRVVYRNNETGELIYGDLAGKSKRVIFKADPDDELSWFPSRDFSIVGLEVFKPDQSKTLAVLNLDGTGYREIAKLDGTSYCGPHWSWDNRYFLCNQSQKEATRLLRISASDGQIRELVSPKTGNVGAAAFSPDGRFVAYQVRASATDPAAGTAIMVLPAEGGESQLIYEERPTAGQSSHALRLLDWTADGRYVAIASERTGKGALHLIPIKDGKSAGTPVFVRYGDFEGGATTAAGGLNYSSVQPGGVWAVHLASLDSNGRLGDWKRLDLHLGNTLNPWPQWSPDGNQIVYVAANEDLGQSGGEVVRLRNLSTGEDREIHHALGRSYCAWAVHQPKLFCSDQAGEGEKTDILSIAVDSGEIATLHTFPASWFLVITGSSHDDRALYMHRYNLRTAAETEVELLQLEIATGRETILEKFAPGVFGGVSLGGPWVVRKTAQNIEIRPMSGGDWKPLVSVGKGVTGTGTGYGHFQLTPDGKWLLYQDKDSAGKHSLYRVATGGGQPERLGDFPTNSGSGTIEISPDGSKIIVASGEYATGYEVWSLENFVPPAPKR